MLRAAAVRCLRASHGPSAAPRALLSLARAQAMCTLKPTAQVYSRSQPTVAFALLRRPLTTSHHQQQQQQQQQQEQQQEQQQQQRNEEQPRRSWNPFRMFRVAFEWYASKLDSNPVITQSLTSGFLFLIGDWTAQRYEHRLDSSKGIDVSERPYLDLLRLAACTSFGLFVLGPFGHHWYSRLDVFTNRMYAPRTMKNVGMKVFLDTAIFNPIFLVVFFTVVSLLEGLTMADIGRKLYRDFVPSYVIDCSVWPPIQTVNFRFVPVKFQLLVVNLGCYFDDVFLSYVQHNGLPAIFQWIETSWLEWIGPEAAAAGLGPAHGHGAPAPALAAAAADKQPIIEVLSNGAQGERVLLVPTDAEHPHQPHAHPIASTKGEAAVPMAHHHIVPRVLVETNHHLSRSHGVDTQLVEELDADWTQVPIKEEDAATAAAAKKAEENRKH